MNHQLELYIPYTEEAVQPVNPEDMQSACIVEISPRKPEPILRVDAEALESKIADTVIQIQVHRNGKVCKFWIDVSITNSQSRPRVRVSSNSPDGRKTRQQDLIGSWRDKRTPIDEWKKG